MAVIFYALLAILIYPAVKWITQYVALRKRLKILPGPINLPLIGYAWQLMKMDAEERFKWLNESCSKWQDKGMFAVWLGTKPNVFIFKPRQAKVILSSSRLITKSSLYNIVKPWLGNGLVTCTGDVWHKKRRMLTPAFHFNNFDDYIRIMQEKSTVMSECFEAHLQNNNFKKSINIFDYTMTCALDIICEAILGVKLDCQRNPGSIYFQTSQRLTKLVTERFLRPWLKWDFVYYQTKKGSSFLNSVEIFNDLSNKAIANELRKREQKKLTKIEKTNDATNGIQEERNKAKTFLEILLDEHEKSLDPLSIDDIRKEVNTIIYAGHDTVASTLSWAFFALGNNPIIQDKLREEIKTVFGDGIKITLKNLEKLHYMDRVIKETLRLYATAPIIARCLDENVEIDDCVIPKGTNVRLNIYRLHRDPQNWNNPEAFNPDRFLPDQHGKHPCSYIPFSFGPRNCLGQKFANLEMKITLAIILHKWKFESVQKSSDIRFVHNIFLRPHDDRLEMYIRPI